MLVAMIHPTFHLKYSPSISSLPIVWGPNVLDPLLDLLMKIYKINPFNKGKMPQNHPKNVSPFIPTFRRGSQTCFFGFKTVNTKAPATKPSADPM